MENLQLWALSWSQGGASDRAQQNDSGALFYHPASATSFARDMKCVSSSCVPRAVELQTALGQLWALGN